MALVLQEEWSDCAPDDDRDGGTIVFDYDEPASVWWVGLADIDEEGGSVRALAADGEVLLEKDLPVLNDNGWQQVWIDRCGVASVEVTLAGSGAVTDLACQAGSRRTRLDDEGADRGRRVRQELRDRRSRR